MRDAIGNGVDSVVFRNKSIYREEVSKVDEKKVS
jgi:hypothetical protein